MADRPIFREPSFIVGLCLTGVVVAVFGTSLLWGQTCSFFGQCISKWNYLEKASPNEVGDTLAGFAGTLAFVWIVVTVWLQATELREQRKEMIRHWEETEKIAVQAIHQTSLLQAEDVRQQNANLTSEVNSHLYDMARTCELFSKVTDLRFDLTAEEISVLPDDKFSGVGIPTKKMNLFEDYSSKELDERVYGNVENLMLANIALSHDGLHRRCVKRARRNLFLEIYVRLEKIFAVLPSLPSHEIARLNSLKLDKFKQSLEEALALDIWEVEETS